MAHEHANPAAGDRGVRQINGLLQEQLIDSPNCLSAQAYIGRIEQARGCFLALDRYGRRLAVAPTIESARDVIVACYRTARRGGLLIIEGGRT